MTHEYKPHGTTTLFAALNVLEGTVIGPAHRRRTPVLRDRPRIGHVAFPLRPTSRTATTRRSLQRPLGPGESIGSLFCSRNPGHARSPDDFGAGLASRLGW